MDNRIWEVVRRIEESQALVVLTGAGVSTDSGISDFRSPDGLYSRWDRNLVFNIDYFHQDPTYFYRFAKEELYRFDSIEPNVTHRLLALLESEGYLKMLITQNIDGLHQKAGTRAIIELQSEFIGRFRADGTITFANDAFCRLVGKPRDELTGASLRTVIPADDYERILLQLRVLTPAAPDLPDNEHRIAFPDGRARWLPVQ